ncbi:histidine phosphotransferase family protein [Oceanicella actignis]|uniref:histidine phosphotransferase family protein n=1 Tax=Oceanicella actignis TaxID=1189325 RepID=UPI0011E77B12|nr:histidine phosphotransferase family protein [Oceanicella actignis]TYO89446.1 histidine phosphotransferase ChpT [Oceanicella actignis]
MSLDAAACAPAVASLGDEAAEPAPAPMSEAELSALMCSRICHDLISPVGAVGNGVELMQEIAPEMTEELGLIGDSARAAAAALEFHRIAFGAAAPGERIAVQRLRRIVEERFARDRARIEWDCGASEAEAGRAAARLLFDMLLVAVGALPRGGRITVTAEFAPGGAASLAVTAGGGPTRLPENARAWLDGAPAPRPAPAEVHYPLTRINALACGARLSHEASAESLALRAEVPAESSPAG